MKGLVNKLKGVLMWCEHTEGMDMVVMTERPYFSKMSGSRYVEED